MPGPPADIVLPPTVKADSEPFEEWTPLRLPGGMVLKPITSPFDPRLTGVFAMVTAAPCDKMVLPIWTYDGLSTKELLPTVNKGTGARLSS